MTLTLAALIFCAGPIELAPVRQADPIHANQVAGVVPIPKGLEPAPDGGLRFKMPAAYYQRIRDGQMRARAEHADEFLRARAIVRDQQRKARMRQTASLPDFDPAVEAARLRLPRRG